MGQYFVYIFLAILKLVSFSSSGMSYKYLKALNIDLLFSKLL